jgi:hypothetical protein
MPGGSPRHKWLVARLASPQMVVRALASPEKAELLDEVQPFSAKQRGRGCGSADAGARAGLLEELRQLEPARLERDEVGLVAPQAVTELAEADVVALVVGGQKLVGVDDPLAHLLDLPIG